MTTMTKSWTDERLEERFDRIDERFDRVEAGLHDLRSDTKAGFHDLRSDTKAGFEQVHADMREIHGRFDGLQRTLLQLGGVAIAALLGLVATQL